jgi:hypothetical protein
MPRTSRKPAAFTPIATSTDTFCTSLYPVAAEHAHLRTDAARPRLSLYLGIRLNNAHIRPLLLCPQFLELLPVFLHRFARPSPALSVFFAIAARGGARRFAPYPGLASVAGLSPPCAAGTPRKEASGSAFARHNLPPA